MVQFVLSKPAQIISWGFISPRHLWSSFPLSIPLFNVRPVLDSPKGTLWQLWQVRRGCNILPIISLQYGGNQQAPDFRTNDVPQHMENPMVSVPSWQESQLLFSLPTIFYWSLPWFFSPSPQIQASISQHTTEALLVIPWSNTWCSQTAKPPGIFIRLSTDSSFY